MIVVHSLHFVVKNICVDRCEPQINFDSQWISYPRVALLLYIELRQLFPHIFITLSKNKNDFDDLKLGGTLKVYGLWFNSHA
jgi:hypothetical protein